MHPGIKSKTLLWWGRFDPHYSRNRIIRNLLYQSGYTITDFRPKLSPLGGIEFLFRGIRKPDAVWVPAFRQRDFHSALRYARKMGVPLIFDPLISAWDKAVYERQKFVTTDRRALKLLEYEQFMFSRADLLLADTTPHARFFIEALKASPEAVKVVPVGAEESLFSAQPPAHARQTEVLFYGSFINLQGPEVIVAAAALVPELQWTLIGSGPLLDTCRHQGSALDNLRFEKWLAYEALAARIGSASILLGIFGSSPKAGRVIPNKVYQALACGRPVITRSSAAYPAELTADPHCGVTFIPPGNPQALAEAVEMLAASPVSFAKRCSQAKDTYERCFSEKEVQKALLRALCSLHL